MPANILFPDDWDVILAMIRQGNDASAARFLIERERRLDSYFSVFDLSQYVPTITQSVNVTYDTATSFVEAFRVGPWISINGYLYISGTGTAGNVVRVSLPLQFPAVPSPSGNGGRTIGIFTIIDFGTTIHHAGPAEITSTSAGLTLLGTESGQSAPLGIAGFTDGLVVNDIVTFSIQYRTTAAS